MIYHENLKVKESTRNLIIKLVLNLEDNYEVDNKADMTDYWYFKELGYTIKLDVFGSAQ